MNKNTARLIAGPLAAAGLAAGALGFAAAANADDPVQAAQDLFSAHSGVIFANAQFISEPDRVVKPGAGIGKLQKAPSAHRPPAAHHAR
jgi:hypothetical protein